MPESDEAAPTEPKEFVQKANGWLSPNWGAGKKSNPSAISATLLRLSQVDSTAVVGQSGAAVLGRLLSEIGQPPSEPASAAAEYKRLKRAVGWQGSPSKGALVLEKVRDSQSLTPELWRQAVDKLLQEAADKSGKQPGGSNQPAWMDAWRTKFEQRLGFPYRTTRDLLWEHVVALDHALRRLSGAHSWIKLAEAERIAFRADANQIPLAAKEWLEAFREGRADDGGSLGEYIIRRRAIDGWDKIVAAWQSLGDASSREQRIEAAREVQRNLDDQEKFGDIQLFAGFGDDQNDVPRPCLADDAARSVWRDGDAPNPQILKDYVAATVADHNQRRFKVPAYRHPDPLRHPVFVDYGNSRWKIAFSALQAGQRQKKLRARLAAAKTEKARADIQRRLDARPDLRDVTLETWNGTEIENLRLRWAGARFSNDLGLDASAVELNAAPVSHADRLGRIAGGNDARSHVSISAVFDQKDWNGRLQAPREQLDRIADLVYGKRGEPDYAKLSAVLAEGPANKQWLHLRWFLTTSAKLTPQGPWLDYVAQGLPQGIEYKKGRSGYYLSYAANEGRKKRARLVCSRLPRVRVLSLDLGHRFGAACAVWETISRQTMVAECRAAGRPDPSAAELFIHLQRPTDKLQRTGRRKGQPVTRTIIYRRIADDTLPGGAEHPAPWARLDRQFVIRLQGEDRPARAPSAQELAAINSLRQLAGWPALGAGWRIDELHREALEAARLASAG